MKGKCKYIIENSFGCFCKLTEYGCIGSEFCYDYQEEE